MPALKELKASSGNRRLTPYNSLQYPLIAFQAALDFANYFETAARTVLHCGCPCGRAQNPNLSEQL